MKTLAYTFIVMLVTIFYGCATLPTQHQKDSDGYSVTDSGLRYRVIKLGEGSIPDENAKVKIHYAGTHLNGVEFDNSRNYSRNPMTLPLNAVIKGWREGFRYMPEGSVFELIVPPELAYGMRGMPSKNINRAIQPNETLKFKIEFIEIAE